jgi:hypothetical protein
MRLHRSLTFSVVVAVFGLIFTAGLVPSASPQKNQETPAEQTAQPAEVTLVGCLMRIDTSAWRPGTSDTTPAGSGRTDVSSGFALKDAAIASSADQTRGPIDTRSAREFSVAKGEVKVDGFAGHQVEVKGHVSGGSIAVTAVRSLSDTCPPAR